jgi:hypothetical protein
LNPSAVLGAAELGHLVISQAQSMGWLGVIAPEEHLLDAAKRTVHAARRVGSVPVELLDVSIGPLKLAQRMMDLPPGPLVLVGFEKLSVEDWGHLDSLRTGLERDQPVLLFLTEGSAEQLSRLAPNLASWLGGSYARWDGSAEILTPEEKEARLDVLRSQFGMTDGEVIQAASEHRLQREPQMSEWLVLLGRGDLLEHD